MDNLLLKLSQSPTAFLEYLGSIELYDDIIFGIVIGIDPKQIKSELKFMDIL